jgi:hypothetical protein
MVVGFDARGTGSDGFVLDQLLVPKTGRSSIVAETIDELIVRLTDLISRVEVTVFCGSFDERCGSTNSLCQRPAIVVR